MPVPIFTARLRSGQMMDALGIDTETLRQRGALQSADLESIAHRCAGCLSPGECDKMLATGAAASDGAPSFCRNRELFSQLVD